MIKWMARAISSGQTEACSKVNGEVERRTVKASTTGKTVKSMKENSMTMNATGLVFFITLVARSLKGSGSLGRRTEDVYTVGQMEPDTQLCTLTGKSKAKASLKERMSHSMRSRTSTKVLRRNHSHHER